MFTRSGARQFADPDLGAFRRSRGWWRGSVDLDQHGPLPLVLPGSRTAPDPDALSVGRTVQLEFDRCQAAIRAALTDHRTAYVNQADADDPALDEQASRPSYVSVVKMDGKFALELGYHVSWDEEHTLGVRLGDGRLIELCGSVLEP